MSASYSEFSSGISHLRAQLNLIKQTRPLYRRVRRSNTLDLALEKYFREASEPQSQEFYYRASIVTLYGLLEHLIESLLSEFVVEISSLTPTYEELPEKIKENHLSLSLEVLTRHSSQKYQKKIDQTSMIKSLHSCFDGGGSFHLNSEAFSFHTANFRSSVVQQSFDKVGISLQKLERSPVLRQEMDRAFPGENNMFFVVNDLAERRNEVAHGSTSELLDVTMLEDYVDIIEAYAKALVAESRSAIIRQAIKHHTLSIGKPDKVFRSCIAGFSDLGAQIKVGDQFALIDSQDLVHTGNIVSIHVDQKPESSANVGDSVGLDMGMKVTRGCRIYAFKQEMDQIKSFGHGIA